MASTTVAHTQWKQARADFLEHWRTERNAADNTISAYNTDLLQLQEFLAERDKHYVNDVTKKDILEFLSHLADRGVSSATYARKLAAIKSFFNYAELNNMTDESPAGEISSPRVPIKVVESLSEAQVLHLLAASRVIGFMPFRLTSMISLAVNRGLESTEIVGLQCADFAETEGTLVVKNGEDERTISLPQDCIEAIQDYLRLERPRIPGSRRSPHLFLNRHGGTLSRQGLWLTLKEFSKVAALDVCNIRLLRSTAVRRMRQVEGLSDMEIRTALGLVKSNKLTLYG